MSNSKLHITRNHTGKMEGMISLSTACTCNPYCQERAMNEKTICHHCFAQRQFGMYGEKFEKPFIENYKLLNSRILDEDELPRINACYFRFEAFGDIATDYHFINYLKICYKNPDTHFAIWTKNLAIMRTVFCRYGWRVPNNLQIIYSSPILNECNADFIFEDEGWDFVDKIFTVYEKGKIDDSLINCGKKKCMDCLLCYKQNGVRFINEYLK